MVGQDQDSQFKVPQGEFALVRLPKRPRELLRAWDAADEYLLEHLAGEGLPVDAQRVVIVNDSFGALAVALQAYSPIAISDSYLSQQATRMNLQGNGFLEDSVKFVDSLATLNEGIDVLLIKVPKTLALLEDELLRLRPWLKPSTLVVVAGMVKMLPASVWGLLEKHIGPTTTSLAYKKARLIFVNYNTDIKVMSSPYPVEYVLENTGYQITNHANVFSRESLDIGTRFFLQHLPSSPLPLKIIDLGCGNGVVGLLAAERNPNASVKFIDESFMAVASARENFHRAFGGLRQADFVIADGLTNTSSVSADVIFCNPPFHQQNTVGDQIALSMFKEAERVLQKNGELWVIGNRHLQYHLILKKLFGNVATVASNAKFVILKSLKR
ncbi:methyltransferase [Methylosoma difficile]